jgi:hypothetical protein
MINDPKDIINNGTLFQEREDDIDTFNDLIRLFDYFTTIEPITRYQLTNMGKVSECVSVPHMVNYFNLFSSSHQLLKTNNYRKILANDKNFGVAFMKLLRDEENPDNSTETYKLYKDFY